MSILLHFVDSISSAQRNTLVKSSIRFIALLSVAGLRHARVFILLPISQVRIKSFLFWGAINVLSARVFDGREGICLIRFLFMSCLFAHTKHKSSSYITRVPIICDVERSVTPNGRVHIRVTKFNMSNLLGIISSKKYLIPNSFLHQLIHNWIILKTISKFILKLTLKQLRHISV
jgi:hypothetical protein